METIRLVTETFLRLLKAEVDPETMLVAADDVFEVPQVPSLVVQGPTLVEDALRRTCVQRLVRDTASMTYQAGAAPRLYHLDFELIATAGHEGELLDLLANVARCYQRHPTLAIPTGGTLNLTELTPMGGGRRVNLSNLRQASGRCRLEDCPVGDTNAQQSGQLVGSVRLDLAVGEQA
jgi:hypothetical protein